MLSNVSYSNEDAAGEEAEDIVEGTEAEDGEARRAVVGVVAVATVAELLIIGGANAPRTPTVPCPASNRANEADGSSIREELDPPGTPSKVAPNSTTSSPSTTASTII